MNNDCIQIDDLLRQLADYKNDYADMATEKLLRKCSTSWEAYRYLLDRVHDTWLPDIARQQVRRIIKKIQVQLNQRREYGWTYDGWWNGFQGVTIIATEKTDHAKSRACPG